MELSCQGVQSRESSDNQRRHGVLFHGGPQDLKAYKLECIQGKGWSNGASVIEACRGDLLGLKAHTLGKTGVFMGFLIFQVSPADRESDSTLAELLSGKHTCRSSHPYLDGCCLC